jgi:2-dehydropantoate 2-reductase
MVSDTASLLWGKLVINAAINPLTALLRVPNGELLERPAARELLAEAALEATSVALKQGISLPYPDPVLAVQEVARNTAANYSSMLQDVMRGTITEIEAINGAIVKMGEHFGVPTPVNRMLWRLVKSLDHQ